MLDLWRDFWIRETGTGQQVAQLHERYIIIIIIIIIIILINSNYITYTTTVKFGVVDIYQSKNI